MLSFTDINTVRRMPRIKTERISRKEFEELFKAAQREPEPKKTIVPRRIPKDYKGPIDYEYDGEWWWIRLSTMTIGCFTSREAAERWARLFLGRA